MRSLHACHGCARLKQNMPQMHHEIQSSRHMLANMCFTQINIWFHVQILRNITGVCFEYKNFMKIENFHQKWEKGRKFEDTLCGINKYQHHSRPYPTYTDL